MEQSTNKAGVKDWLEATKGMVIVAHVESQPLILAGEQQPFTRADSEQALRKVSRKVKK